ncbi:hypothetical protein [Thiohalorhabdus methylotrophus]|uniref:Uncharacterized protein n=1 Tax=Thiohalorhabdus methylotrophus TaxID=3242694 RepID=A0ABV4TUP2_9GAMM
MATLHELDEVLRETADRLAELGQGDSEITDRYLRKARSYTHTLRNNLALEAQGQVQQPGDGRNGDDHSSN